MKLVLVLSVLALLSGCRTISEKDEMKIFDQGYRQAINDMRTFPEVFKQ